MPELQRASWKHDFTVELTLPGNRATIRLCARCAKVDVAATRRRPCEPLAEQQLKASIERRVQLLIGLLAGG